MTVLTSQFLKTSGLGHPGYVLFMSLLCPVPATRIIFLQNALNFTISSDYQATGLIKFECRTEKYDPVLMRCSDCTPSILYCKSGPRLPQGCPVWLSPFSHEIWAMIGLTGLSILAFQLFKKDQSHISLRHYFDRVSKPARPNKYC